MSLNESYFKYIFALRIHFSVRSDHFIIIKKNCALCRNSVLRPFKEDLRSYEAMKSETIFKTLKSTLAGPPY